MTRVLALLLLGGLLACAGPGGDADTSVPPLVRPDRATQLQSARAEVLGRIDTLRSGLAASRAGVDALDRMVGRMNSSLDGVQSYVTTEDLDVPTTALFELRLRGDGLRERSDAVLGLLQAAEQRLDIAESLLLDSFDRLESAPQLDVAELTEIAELDELRSSVLDLADELQPVIKSADGLVTEGSRLAGDAERLQEDVRHQLSLKEPMGMKTILRNPETDIEVSRAPGDSLPGDSAAAAAAVWQNDRVAEIVTSKGSLVVELFADDAPAHVENFKKLIELDYYDGMRIHRVVPGFLVQAGCKVGNGTGGPGWQIDAEFNDRPHVRGTLSMARFAHPDSAGSQFFIVLAEDRSLDGKYTVFGRLVKGGKALTRIEDLGSLDGSTSEPVLIHDVVLRERRPDEVAASDS